MKTEKTYGQANKYRAISVTYLSYPTLTKWRMEWQSTPVFLPGESHGQRGLAGYGTWGRKELDVTLVTEHNPSIGLA